MRAELEQRQRLTRLLDVFAVVLRIVDGRCSHTHNYNSVYMQHDSQRKHDTALMLSDAKLKTCLQITFACI